MDNLESSEAAGSYSTAIVISLAVLMGSSIVIITYHLLFVKLFRTRQRSTASFPITWNSEGMLPIETGVGQRVLDAIPIFSYTSEPDKTGNNLFAGDEHDCVVCLGELEEGDKVRVLPNCGHLFHVPCIDDWFLAHASCPICRAPVVAPRGNLCCESAQNLAQFLEQREEDQEECEDNINVNGGNRDEESTGRLLRHSLSLVLPQQQQQRLMGLTRSLSMDQSFIVIDIQRESDKIGASASASSSSSLSRGALMERGCRGPYMRPLDRMSWRLMRSFSQLRMGRSVVATGLLP